MAGIASVGGVGPGLEGVQIAIELQAAALRTQIETVRDVGDLAVQLIQSAQLDPSVGRNLDIRV